MSFLYNSIAFITQVDTIIDANMVKSMKNYGQPGYDGVTRTWNMVQHDVSIDKYESSFLIVVKQIDILQINIKRMKYLITFQLNCCGAQEYMDWKNTTFGQNGDSVPDSCCILDAEDCGKGILKVPDEVVFRIKF